MTKFRLMWIAFLVIIAAFPAAANAPSAWTDELAGLWKAKRWFGPFARGPLVIERTGATYTAEMIGRTLPIHVDRDELSFELPNGQGSFRGKLQAGGAILGHWYPPSSVSGKYASPVHLKPEGPN